jgi:hypothetical protein
LWCHVRLQLGVVMVSCGTELWRPCFHLGRRTSTATVRVGKSVTCTPALVRAAVAN